MRALLVPACLVAACGTPSEPPDDHTPHRVDVAQCTETYTVPGALGSVREDGIDPHADVFDAALEPVVAGAEAAFGPDPVHEHLGWPGSDTARAVSFVWWTNTGTQASVVELAEGDDLSGEVTRYEGVSYRYGGPTADQYRVHELKLCGRVEPATTYSYRVGGDGHWSDVHTFTTPPAPGTFDAFTAVFAGDSRGSYEDWTTLIARARAEDPDLFLFSGDMVALGSDEADWYGWWEATDGWFAETFFVPAHGNHEALTANYFAQFSLPNNEQWFSVDYGSLTVASLNDTVSDVAHLETEEVAFLEEVFGASSAEWKVAMHHQPTYTTSGAHPSNEDLRAYWEGTFEAEGVDLVLNGHNHTYERSVPIREGAETTPADGVTYLVSGGAGAPLYEEHDEAWFGAKAATTYHYVVAEFGPTGVQLTVKDLAGSELDSFFVPKDE